MIILLVSLSGCENAPDINKYFTAFESLEGQDGWTGIDDDMFVDDSPYDGAGQSLKIGGGCLQPAARIVFENTIKPGNYKIACWGKMIKGTSGAVLFGKWVGDESVNIWIDINRPEWKYYETDDALTILEGDTVFLDLLCGGIVYNEMLINHLKLIKTQ